MTARLNYVAQLHEIPQTVKHAITQDIHLLVRNQFGLATPTILHSVYTPPDQGGLGLENANNLADRAMVTEYILALNSTKEAYTAKLLRENAETITRKLPSLTNPKRLTGKTTHTAWCRTCMEDGYACTCYSTTVSDTMHAQALRSAARLGWRITATDDLEHTLGHLEAERKRNMHNGKKQLTHGELVWLRHRATGDERLAAFHGTNPEGTGAQNMALTWLPRLFCQRGGKHNNILGRATDSTNRGIPTAKAYIESAELLREYSRHGTHKREVLTRITEQWQPDSKLTHIKQIPGLSSYWVEKWEDWAIHQVTAPHQDITLRWKKAGKLRKKTINLRIVEAIGDEIDLQPNPALQDKRTLKAKLQDPLTEQITAWTDGARKPDGTLGVGIHIPGWGPEDSDLDLAWRPYGVSGVLGAELTPLTKILEWAHADLRVTIHIDSQAAIDTWNIIKHHPYTDREIAKHPECNAILSLNQSLQTKPKLRHNVALIKVISHIGISGNEKADLLATLGAEGQATTHVKIRERLAFTVVDPQGQILRGNLRKIAKNEDQRHHKEKWARNQGPQGDIARTLAETKRQHRHKHQRLHLSHKKYTREINSIRLQQHKWQYGELAQAKPEHTCKLCRKAYSSAAHRLHECLGTNTTHMMLAMLKQKWNHAIVTRRIPPKCLKQEITFTEDWCTYAGRSFPTPLVLALYEAHMDERREDKQAVHSFLRMLRTDHSKAAARRMPLTQPEQAPAGPNNRQVLKVRGRLCTPNWLGKALGQLGIHKELCEDRMHIQPEFDEHAYVTEHTTPPHELQGGTFRNMLNAQTTDIQRWCVQIRNAIDRMDTENQVATHTLLLQTDTHADLAQEHMGTVIAHWPTNEFATTTDQWLQTGKTHLAQSQQPTYLIQWCTKGIED